MLLPPRDLQTLSQLSLPRFTSRTFMSDSLRSRHTNVLTVPPIYHAPSFLGAPTLKASSPTSYKSAKSHRRRPTYLNHLILTTCSLFWHFPSSAGFFLSIVPVIFHYTVKALLLYRFFESELLSVLITAVS